MAHFLWRHCQDLWRRCSGFLLAFFFLAGLVSGIGLYTGDASDLWMGSYFSESVPILRLILLTFFPFLLSAFAVFLKKPGLILAVSYLKGCLFSFTAFCLTACCGSAGWLLRLLLLFSDSLSLPLLCFFWLRYVPGDKGLELGDLFFCFSMVSLICCMEHCVITPFLAGIIIF